MDLNLVAGFVPFSHANFGVSVSTGFTNSTGFTPSTCFTTSTCADRSFSVGHEQPREVSKSEFGRCCLGRLNVCPRSFKGLCGAEVRCRTHFKCDVSAPIREVEIVAKTNQSEAVRFTYGSG
jgi:hypothetical protein